jgi:hypothetical protein
MAWKPKTTREYKLVQIVIPYAQQQADYPAVCSFHRCRLSLSC